MAYLIKTLVVSTGILWNAESLAKCSIAYNYVKAIFFPYTINIYHILFALLRHNQNHESAIIIERGNKKKGFSILLPIIFSSWLSLCKRRCDLIIQGGPLFPFIFALCQRKHYMSYWSKYLPLFSFPAVISG